MVQKFGDRDPKDLISINRKILMLQYDRTPALIQNMGCFSKRTISACSSNCQKYSKDNKIRVTLKMVFPIEGNFNRPSIKNALIKISAPVITARAIESFLKTNLLNAWKYINA